MDVDLRALTSAQLTTLQTNLLDRINGNATGPQSGSAAGQSFAHMSAKEAMEMLSAVNREITLRADTAGGLIVVEFEEPA